MNKPVTIRIIAVVSIFLFVVSLHAQTQAEINAAARADFTKADIVSTFLCSRSARGDAPGEMDNGYSADLLYTLRFDGAGKWKIVKTHRMSEKEVKEHR